MMEIPCSLRTAGVFSAVRMKQNQTGGTKMYQETYDIEELRAQLRDYYGTAMMSGFPAAVIDLGKIERMDDEEIVEEAKKAGII